MALRSDRVLEPQDGPRTAERITLKGPDGVDRVVAAGDIIPVALRDAYEEKETQPSEAKAQKAPDADKAQRAPARDKAAG